MNAQLQIDRAGGPASELGPEATIRAAAPEDPATAEYRAKVYEAAEKFEGFFIAQLLRQMRQSTREVAGEDSIYSGRVNQDMLDMADVALADSLAGQRAFGIADAILRQLLPPAAAAAAPLKEPAVPVASSEG
jgi:peptidoglycan hydrolase FlgJ